jgi:integrase
VAVQRSRPPQAWEHRFAGDPDHKRRPRRVLKLPVKAVEALRDHRTQQAAARLKAGPLWQDHGLVFASAVGTPLDAHNVRRSFRAFTRAVELGEEWTPRELRHTFVSLLSAHDVTLEDIARKRAQDDHGIPGPRSH